MAPDGITDVTTPQAPDLRRYRFSFVGQEPRGTADGRPACRVRRADLRRGVTVAAPAPVHICSIGWVPGPASVFHQFLTLPASAPDAMPRIVVWLSVQTND